MPSFGVKTWMEESKSDINMVDCILPNLLAEHEGLHHYIDGSGFD